MYLTTQESINDAIQTLTSDLLKDMQFTNDKYETALTSLKSVDKDTYVIVEDAASALAVQKANEAAELGFKLGLRFAQEMRI